ncbi:hypothetical protein Acr_15g0013520 [Actinidia rufa]|uniref:Rx N-terminal domain-containing protein n=1 Tax=Actinidia rufa TaxID=165716 RepID=A0A7J0FVY2_9ERIC|nr:hypothetical protein Acr_15g0013520 [Actinidia rufa]
MAMIAVNVVLEKLATLLAEEAQLLGGVRWRIGELRDDLESMRSFLQDAEERSTSDQGVRTWVKQVRNVACDTEDVIEKFLLRLPPTSQGHGFFRSLRKGYHFLRHLRTRHQLAHQIDDVKMKMKAILERRNAFAFRRIEEATNSRMFASTYGMSLPAGIGGLTNLQKMGNVEVHGDGDLVGELGKLTQLRRTLDLFILILSLPLRGFYNALYLKCILPTLPKWITSLQYLAKLVLQYSYLNDDPLEALQGLSNLVVLELREAYVGEELCCNVGGYPRLKMLGLKQLRQLKCIRVEQGAMSGLRELDIASCKKLEMMPMGIEHLRNLQHLVVWAMPRRFYQKIERPHGDDFWRVQHVETIEVLG